MSGRGGIYEGPDGEKLHGDGRKVNSSKTEIKPTNEMLSWKIAERIDNELIDEFGEVAPDYRKRLERIIAAELCDLVETGKEMAAELRGQIQTIKHEIQLDLALNSSSLTERMKVQMCKSLMQHIELLLERWCNALSPK